jgi:hypothetical protein
MVREAEIREVAQRRYWREAEARVVVQAWRSSGEGLARFARRHDLRPNRLGWWVRRLGSQGQVHFHAVRLVQQQPDSDGSIEIEFNGGRLVRVRPGFEAEDLRHVLEVLREAATC